MHPKILLLIALLASCRTPETSTTLAATNEATVNDCRWSKAQSYDELKATGLFKYDLPDAAYLPASYNAKSLNSTQVLEDLACVRLMFTNAYAGTSVFKAQGEDLVANLDRTTAIYAQNGAPNLSQTDLQTMITGLWGKAYDGHQSVTFYSLKHAYSGIFGELYNKTSAPPFMATSDQAPGQELVSCQGMHQVPTFDGTTRSVAWAGYLPPNTTQFPTTVACTKSSDQSVNVAVKPYQFDVVLHTPTERASGAALISTTDGIDILTILDFPNVLTDAQTQIAAQLAASDRPLIIDLRGDGGGAPAFNEALQKALFATSENVQYEKGTQIWSLLKELAYTQSIAEEAEGYRVNPAEPDAHRADDIAKTNEFLREWESAAAQTMSQLGIHSMADVKAVSDDYNSELTSGARSTPRTAPVVVLIDRGCGSQCEFFLAAVRHLPTAQGHILGMPTAGRLNFGNDGTLYLPNSHLSLITSGESEEFNPTVVEGEGIQPDLFLLSGDAKAEALAYMRGLLGTN